ncbi:MAG: DUF6122 family protein [Desulfopila sp.]
MSRPFAAPHGYNISRPVAALDDGRLDLIIYRAASLVKMVATLPRFILDHLLGDPVFDPSRCSIGFHPLHSGLAISVYLGMADVPATRLIGVGLLIHMGLDGLNCIGIP